MTTSKRETLIVGLRNLYGLEGQAVSTLDNAQSGLEHYPELKAAVVQHLAESRRQQEQVGGMLEGLGESPSTLKDAVMKLAGNVQAMVHGMAGDTVLKNLFTLYAFEHFEIASYRSAVAMAEEVGEPGVAQTCREILRQEEAAAQKLGGMIESTTKTYMAREAAGQQSAT
ncbi:MAG TPA: ferritin-like domain-containing protein [Rubellimicrobium sp.]|nr:ferritin-like domain-containing protein [Rubellimicrobium sp.]